MTYLIIIPILLLLSHVIAIIFNNNVIGCYPCYLFNIGKHITINFTSMLYKWRINKIILIEIKYDNKLTKQLRIIICNILILIN